MSHPVGIMQGRLLPPFEGRFQAFPAVGWQEEFPRARAAGLAGIEWIYEIPHEDENPLRTDEGLAQMRRLMGETGVLVRSICADCCMQSPLVVDGRPQRIRVDHLEWLLARAAALGAWYVVLPFVDASSLRTAADRDALRAVLGEVLPVARRLGVEIHLETDLPPQEFTGMLAGFDDRWLKANHDIGNSAALGHDPDEELRILGPRIGSVHVKDRVLRGASVALGTGNADFPSSFRLLRAAGYARPFILQASRGVEGEETTWAGHNREFVERQLAALP